MTCGVLVENKKHRRVGEDLATMELSRQLEASRKQRPAWLRWTRAAALRQPMQTGGPSSFQETMLQTNSRGQNSPWEPRWRS